MLTQIDRRVRRRVVRERIRRKCTGTPERPRVAAFRSLKHFYLQAVDDTSGKTICSASTLDPELRQGAGTGGNIPAAKAVGALMASRLLERGIEIIVFDRGGFGYHGRVKAAAEAARQKGLKF